MPDKNYAWKSETVDWNKIELWKKMALYTKAPYDELSYRHIHNAEFGDDRRPPTTREENDLIDAWDRGGFLIADRPEHHPTRKWVHQNFFVYVYIEGDHPDYNGDRTILLMPTQKLEHSVKIWKRQREVSKRQRHMEPYFIISDKDEISQRHKPPPKLSNAAKPPAQKDSSQWTTKRPRQLTI
jgi:hypothetical protein